MSNSRKIVESELFDTSVKAIKNETFSDENRDLLFVNTLHLLAICLNDLPAQIPKFIANGLIPQLVEVLESRVPKQASYFS